MKSINIRFLAAIFVALIVFTVMSSYAKNQGKENVFAWCIVPFDKLERTPGQRIKMLKELGISKYAYDWRSEHLRDMEKEIYLARENGIEMNAVWMWIDKNDEIGKLSPNNEKVLEIIKKTRLKTQLWISFPENYFDDLSEMECLNKSVSMIKYLSDELNDTDCAIGLYNHGGWFGDPLNLVKIVKQFPENKVGIIFNFHHAHHLLENYNEMIKAISPYLWAVNLNGMKVEGPKILPLGKGMEEKWMIEVLKENNFSGPWGILGHRTDRDVKMVLMENLKGFELLFNN